MLKDTLESRAARIDSLCEEMALKGYGTLPQLGELRVIAAELRGIALGLGEVPASPPVNWANGGVAEKLRALEAQKRARQEESMSQEIRTIRGGPLDGTSVPCPAGVPDGAHTSIAGVRYTAVGGELLHDPETQAKREGS